MKRFIGIDPGKNGGIATIDDDGTPAAWKMPPTETDLWDILHEYDTATITAAIEKATGMIPGARGSMGIAKLQYNRGCCVMALTAAGIPFVEVQPAKWQKEFGLYGKKWKSDTEKKNAHKRVAQQLFPTLKITHRIADALLIAEWLRRTEPNSRNAAGGE